MNEYGTLTGEN